MEYEEEDEGENENNPDIPTKDIKTAIQYSIALISCGFTISRMADFQILMNRDYPSRKLVTQAMNILRPVMCELVQQSCEYWKGQMQQNSIISIDGSWNHRRRGTYEIFDVICVQLKKIIAFDIRIHQSHNIPGNTLSTASAMEGESFQILLPQLESDPRISCVVKDGDVQIDKMITDSGWEVDVRPDPNHLMKHFEQRFQEIVPQNIRTKFRGICPFIKQQLVNTLYMPISKVQKLEHIDNIENIILHCPFLPRGTNGNLFYWKSRKNADCIQKVDQVIDYCKGIILQFDRGVTTNYNEAFHALKAILVPKIYNLGHSTDLRLYASVLQYNDGNEWIKELFKRFDLNMALVDKLIDYRNKRHQDKSAHDFFNEKRSQQNAQNEEDRVQRHYEDGHNIPHHV